MEDFLKLSYSSSIVCSQFQIDLELQDIENIGVIAGSGFHGIHSRILPYQVAPVIVSDKNVKKLTPMRFSLVPSWSQEPKVKFATHNARIETVCEKPTWKNPFKRQHCVIPMTGFFESAYVGPEVGHILKFKDENYRLLFASGIFDFWQNSEDTTKNFFSFSILTREPSTFITEHGHDRTPIFIDAENIDFWLNDTNRSENEIRDQLLQMAIHPHVSVEIDRALKPGWEKRKD